MHTCPSLRLYHGLCIGIILFIIVPSAQAQNDNLDDHYVDFAVPDLSAFTLLGIEASRISRPGNVREFIASMTNEIGKSGALEQGVGMELAPFFMLANPRTIQSYNPLRDRFTLSLATIKETDTTRFGIGLRWVLIDRADPYESEALGEEIRAGLRMAMRRGIPARMRNDFDEHAQDVLRSMQPDDESLVVLLDILDLAALDEASDHLTVEAVQELLSDKLREQGMSPTEAELADLMLLAADYVRLVRIGRGADLEAELNQLIVDRKKKFRERTWNALSVQVAGGLTSRTSAGMYDLNLDEFNAFAGVSLPVIPRYGQLIGHIQIGLPLSGGNDDLGAAVGGRLLLGNATRRFSLDGLYGMNDRRLSNNGDNYRLTVGGEFRLADGTYLELAAGVNVPEEGATSFLTLGSIKYALRKDRRFAIP